MTDRITGATAREIRAVAQLSPEVTTHGQLGEEQDRLTAKLGGALAGLNVVTRASY